MKKILFAAYSLDLGGIETALVTLINYLAKKQYDITLVLEKKEGIFLDTIDKNIKIIEYSPSYNKNRILAKIKNALNRLKFILKYKNKFDCAISFATYSLSSSFIARTSSKNSVLWVHNNYLNFFENDERKYLEFFNNVNAEKFTKIVFVSEESKKDFENRYKNLKDKLIVCNNLIDYNKIIKKSEEVITDFKKDKNEITFLNIGRHDEKQKQLTKLIKSAEVLKKENYKFKIILVGVGPDTRNYQKQVKDLNLEKEIIFLGPKKNPYPYFKECDSVILTSNFEGYPVVYIESLVFNKPIITTDVSDSKKDIEGKYGIVCSKDVKQISKAMEEFINNGYEIKNKFDPEKYNNEIIKKIEDIILK